MGSSVRVITSRARGSRDRLIAYGLLALGTWLVVLAHWPGGMNADTLGTIAFVRTGWISDQFSPVLTWVWRQAYRVVNVGPGVVLAVQVAALVAGFYLVLRAAFGRIAASALALAVLLAPPAFGLVGLVGRDGWFVAGCLLAVGAGVAALRWRRPASGWALAAGFAAAAVAVAARQNGFTAVAPIMAGLAFVALGWVRGLPLVLGRHRVLCAVAVGCVATMAVTVATVVAGNVVRDEAFHPEVNTYVYDLGYLTITQERRLISIPRHPRDVQLAQTVGEVRRRWAPTNSLTLRLDPAWRWDIDRWLEDPRQTQIRMYPDDPGRASDPAILVPLHYSDEQADRLSEAWREAIADHPLSYLAGRFGLWRRMIGIGQAAIAPGVDAPPANPYGYVAASFPVLSGLAADWRSLWAGPNAWTGSAVHRAWPYLLVCLLGFVLLLPRFPGQVRMVGVLVAAVVGLQIGLFFLAPAVELRLQLFTLYAAMLTLAVAARLAWGSGARSLDG